MFFHQTMDIDSLISRLVHAKSGDRLKKKDAGSPRCVFKTIIKVIFYQDRKNSLLFEFAFLPLACMISVEVNSSLCHFCLFIRNIWWNVKGLRRC